MRSRCYSSNRNGGVQRLIERSDDQGLTGVLTLMERYVRRQELVQETEEKTSRVPLRPPVRLKPS